MSQMCDACPGSSFQSCCYGTRVGLWELLAWRGVGEAHRVSRCLHSRHAGHSKSCHGVPFTSGCKSKQITARGAVPVRAVCWVPEQYLPDILACCCAPHTCCCTLCREWQDLRVGCNHHTASSLLAVELVLVHRATAEVAGRPLHSTCLASLPYCTALPRSAPSAAAAIVETATHSLRSCPSGPRMLQAAY